MLLAAAQRHELNLVSSWMIGDKASDIRAARRAGIRNTIRLASRYPAGTGDAKSLFECRFLSDAVAIISSQREPVRDLHQC